ncbi:MAG: FAD-binding protein [Chloroflexi bacterium]|jgi:FAD/FMN-containing dehydrogenase/Fe-S oxidoreductase|nr:FAD-binding protein [Chloroflexota bacterium]MBT6681462.1 FAD-binding protein [Chloroflexota bacterium]
MTTSVRSDLAAELKSVVQGEVRFDQYSRALYSQDASIYSMEPAGVVLPQSVEDVQAIMEICNRNGVKVLSRGGGTGLSGQTVQEGAVVIDYTKYMHDLIEINAEEQWVRTQPGVTLTELNRQLRPHGLMFTPDPSTASRATVGGAMGNNSCGAHSIIYGKTVDHVLGQDVVLSNGNIANFENVVGSDLEAKLRVEGLEGDIYRTVRDVAARSAPLVEANFPKVLRRVGGYNLDLVNEPDGVNLAQLMVGSEGTLAAVTSARLNLVKIPEFTGLAVLHFKALDEAMEATVATLEHEPSAVEHIGAIIITQARRHLLFSRNLGFLQGEPTDILVVEFNGGSLAEIDDKFDKLEQDMQRKELGFAMTRLRTAAEQGQVWAMRENGLGLMNNIEGTAKPLPFVEDTAVAPEKLPEYVRRFQQIIKNSGTEAGYYGHASVGCMHIRPLIDIKTREGMDRLYKISDEVSDLLKEFGGSMTGEHGDGIVRGFWTEKMFGPELVDNFREVKKAFDPNTIMNPGKVFDTPHLLDNLRFGDEYHTHEIETRLDFTKEGGFSAAIEMCNGVGACRKLNLGAMCPSYIATREETHTTRGRANVLRAAISGKFPIEDLTSKATFDVLDLCLECKSCKAECPSNVDMAKIKYEFLHQYYKTHKVPRRSKMVADIHKTNARMAPIAPIANAVTRSAPMRWALDKLVGFSSDRPAPPVVRNTFQKWFDSRKAPAGTHPRGQIVLFHDTFMNFNYPSIGVAATDLLEALGFEVIILKDRKCCGRPMVSKGLLDMAAENARHNVDLLYNYAQRGVKIAGCESSCVMAIKDEYPDLLGGEEKARVVSDATVMLEEVIAECLGDDGPQLEFTDLSKKVQFLGHCHQRALTGLSSSLKALNLPPNYEVTDIPAGCCGMAGSFGYESEHVEVSLAAGEERFFPHVRNNPDHEVCVTGVSCREQTVFGTGRKARHLVEVLADALKK